MPWLCIEKYEDIGFDHGFTDTSHNTVDYLNRFKEEIEKHVYYCESIEGYDTPIEENTQYRVAVRIPMCRETGRYYHIIYQLSDGRWAGKDGDLDSQCFESGNPSETPAMWVNDAYPASSGTIYFAVQR